MPTQSKRVSFEYGLLMKMDDKWVALRGVEIQRAFSHSGSGQLAFLDLPDVMRMGQITRLANMMRRRGIIQYDTMRALGALLGMQPDTIDSNLKVMEALAWATVHRDSRGNITRIEDHTPNLEKVLDTLGNIYTSDCSNVPYVSRLSKLEEGRTDIGLTSYVPFLIFLQA